MDTIHIHKHTHTQQANDIAIVSAAKTVVEIEKKTNVAIQNVGAWLLDEACLTLAAHKTGVVLISG